MEAYMANHSLLALVEWLLSPAIMLLGEGDLYTAFMATFEARRVPGWKKLRGAASARTMHRFRVRVCVGVLFVRVCALNGTL